MAKKKTLYKIPTEDEISGSKKISEAEVSKPTEEEVSGLPVVEPEPVVVLDTAEEKSEALRIAKERAKAKLAEDLKLKEKRASIPVAPYAGEPVADFSSISSGQARLIKSNEEARKRYDEEQAKSISIEELITETKPDPQPVYDHETARLVFASTGNDITQMEGISVGGRNVVHAKNTKRVTREKRRENIKKRRSLKVMVAGEEQELSEASKYMLDMLIKNQDKK